MSTPGDAAERTADAAAHIFGQRAQPDRSLALDLRDALRATRTPRPMAQRAVPTWAGEFDTDKYSVGSRGSGYSERRSATTSATVRRPRAAKAGFETE